MPVAHNQMESEAATSDEAKLDVIHSSQLKPYLTQKVKQFQAGCIKNHFSGWASFTMDKEILRSVSGLFLKFLKLPHYHNGLKMRFSSKEVLFLADEINLLQKGVIKESQHEEEEFTSPIILVPKSENSFRMILTLKKVE